MPDADKLKHDGSTAEVSRIVAEATERARFKQARLRRLKERNELYLASRRIDADDTDEMSDEDVTRELE
jgi:hypothetical protein